MKKKFAIVTGEPDSINIEIIGKVWKKLKSIEKNNLFLIGNYKLIKFQFETNKIKIPLKIINNTKSIKSNNFLHVFDVHINFKNFDKVNKNDNRKYILKSLDLADYLAKNKYIKGFINCSIDKEKTFKSQTLGVTEYLAKKNKLKNSEVMMIYNQNLSVVPITTHIQLKNVSKKLSSNLIYKKILNLNKYYLKIFRKKPYIGIMGLNPHNFENRDKSEEKRIIAPAIKRLKRKKLKIIGPMPADTAFSKSNKKKLDVIVGMYHDQVLGPFKALFGFDAINITLGLNYVRVSPDHGTGKEIAGFGVADPSSLVQCVKFLKNFKND